MLSSWLRYEIITVKIICTKMHLCCINLSMGPASPHTKGPLLVSEIGYTNIWSMAWIMNYILIKQWHVKTHPCPDFTWWRHQMETFSALLAICAGNPPVPGEFPAQRPVTRSFDVFFDLHLNKRLSKLSRGCWFETLSHSLWCHRNELTLYMGVIP